MFKIASVRATVSFGAIRSAALRKAPVAMSVRSLYISTESPKANPNMMKFTVDQELLDPLYGLNFLVEKDEEDPFTEFPLARDIYKLGDGAAVTSVFFSRRAVNITKTSDFSWTHLEPAIRNILTDYFAQPNREFELDPPPFVPDPLEDDETNEESRYNHVKYIEHKRRDQVKLEERKRQEREKIKNKNKSHF